MASMPHPNASTKVIRIQDDEKELLSRLREIYGNDYKKYGEYIRRESGVPLTIKRIYKLLDERKAYRRISDYFHRERAAKRAKDTNTHGINGAYTRSSTRGVTQVPEQMSSIHTDHDMDEDDDINHDDDDIPTLIDNDQQQPTSPTITNGSDELVEINHTVHDDEQHHSNRNSSRINLNYARRRILPSMNQKCSIYSSPINGKSDLISVRSHLEKALRELDRALTTRDDSIEDEQQRSMPVRNNFLTNGHRHSKLDDIVRSLSNVVSQQQENSRLILDESSLLLVADDTQQTVSTSSTTHQSMKTALERLNALIDRGNSIYDRIESILSDF